MQIELTAQVEFIEVDEIKRKSFVRLMFRVGGICVRLGLHSTFVTVINSFLKYWIDSQYPANEI